MAHTMNEPDAQRTTAELVKTASEQISRLVRDELRLAQAELTRKGKHAGLGAGLFGAGGLVALYGVAALLTAVVLLLTYVMPAWLAAVIVGVLLLGIAGVLALVGKKQVQQATPVVPEDTVRSVKADVATVTEAVKSDTSRADTSRADTSTADTSRADTSRANSVGGSNR